jgi:hypothetical protein
MPPGWRARSPVFRKDTFAKIRPKGRRELGRGIGGLRVGVVRGAEFRQRITEVPADGSPRRSDARFVTVHMTLALPSAADGRPVSLAEFRGKKLIINIFASW